jgi:hypothetical protein
VGHWRVVQPGGLRGRARAPLRDCVGPLGPHAHTAAYLARLQQRPSFARVLEEAKPYFSMFPARAGGPGPPRIPVKRRARDADQRPGCSRVARWGMRLSWLVHGKVMQRRTRPG